MALSSDEDAHIYWHRELPPDDAEALGEHVLEATSDHVTGTITHGDEQWRTCYESLMAHVRARFAEEVMRLGGTCAHVLKEHIEPRHNDAAGDGWLYGRFEYVLFRGASKPDRRAAAAGPRTETDSGLTPDRRSDAQVMSNAMVKHEVVRVRLTSQLDRLLERAGRIESDLRRVPDRDWQEQATELENDEVLKGLDEMTLGEVHRIRAALRRIANGTYGSCSTCGRAIGEARLAAMPSATTCLTCSAEARENA